MSTKEHPQSAAEAVTVTVQKSDIDGLLSARADTGLDGEYLWPIEPRALAKLYRASSEHSRAIHVKAESAFGGGLLGEASKIEELCDTGATELFTQLGLDLETYGNAFLQVIRSSDGERILGLRRLPAVTMCRLREGFLQRVPRTDGDTQKIRFTAREIVHLKELCPEGRHYSMPTWIGAAGIVTQEEARALLPALANLSGSSSEGAGEPIARSAPTTRIQALAALLARS